MNYFRLLALGVVLVLAACSDKPEKPPYAGIKIGKPYQIYGRWYKPHYEQDYDETGMASWYGPGFHGGKTASGERYNQEDMTAAHRTLPLPSIVRVTNLDNGRTALIKVNDRGPFARDRIIDLSRASAEKLGMIASGTARVRVQFLDKETRDYVSNRSSEGVRVATKELKTVDPDQAIAEQEQSKKPQFYVMKVPAGVKPPPDAVPVSEKEAVRYPVGNIFAMADKEIAEEINDSAPQKSPKRKAAYTPAPQQAEHYLAEEPASSKPLLHAPVNETQAGGYFLQMGAFGKKANAENLAARIQPNASARVIPSLSNGTTLYRVVVGPFNELTSAKNMLSKLGALGIPEGKIIHN